MLINNYVQLFMSCGSKFEAVVLNFRFGYLNSCLAGKADVLIFGFRYLSFNYEIHRLYGQILFRVCHCSRVFEI